MEFKTGSGINVIGTHLQGYVETTHARLHEVFGESADNFDDYKCDAEWCVEFKDGTIATVYNYKNGENYLGAEGAPVEDITDWNIGGFTKDAVSRIHEAIA